MGCATELFATAMILAMMAPARRGAARREGLGV
jgi:hypothetical protein